VPEGRFLTLLQNKEFWMVTLFLVLLGGSVGLFGASKNRRSIGQSVSLSVPERSASSAIFSLDWQRAEVPVRKGAGLRAGLARARALTVVRLEKASWQS
jgi:hypothetical protein